MSTGSRARTYEERGRHHPPSGEGGTTEGGKRRTAGTFLPCSASVYLPTEVRLDIPTFDGDYVTCLSTCCGILAPGQPPNKTLLIALKPIPGRGDGKRRKSHRSRRSEAGARPTGEEPGAEPSPPPSPPHLRMRNAGSKQTTGVHRQPRPHLRRTWAPPPPLRRGGRMEGGKRRTAGTFPPCSASSTSQLRYASKYQLLMVTVTCRSTCCCIPAPGQPPNKT